MNLHLDVDKSFTIMTDVELVENLKLISGLPSIFCFSDKTSLYFLLDPKSVDVFDYKPFVDMMIPILRADAKVCVISSPKTFFLDKFFFVAR